MKAIPNKASRLDKLWAAAEADSTRLYNQLKAAEAFDPVAQKALRRKFRLANEKAAALRTLIHLLDELMAKRLEHARECRERAGAYSPSLKQSTIAQAVKIEREYRLWCEHHGKDIPSPAPSSLSKIKREPPRPPAPPAPRSASSKSRHGGRRIGAGRKPAGNKQLLLRVKPETINRLKDVARKAGFATPGEWLDAQMRNAKS